MSLAKAVRPPYRLLSILSLLLTLPPGIALGQSQDGDLRHGFLLFGSSHLEAGATLITLYPRNPERFSELIELAYDARVRFREEGTNITSASGSYTNANAVRMLAIETSPAGTTRRHFLHNWTDRVAECGRFRSGGSGRYSGSPDDVLTAGDTQETLDISCIFPRRGGSGTADIGYGTWMPLSVYNHTGVGGSVTFRGEGGENTFSFTVNGRAHDHTSYASDGTRATVVLGPPGDSVQNTSVSLRIDPARTDGRYFSDESVSAHLDFSFDYRYRLWGRATVLGIRPADPAGIGLSVSGGSGLAFRGQCEDRPADVPAPSGSAVATVSTGCSLGPVALPSDAGELEMSVAGGRYMPRVQGMDQRDNINLPSGLTATLTVVDDTEPVFGGVTGGTALTLGEAADWTPPAASGGNPPLVTTYTTTGALPAGLSLDPASGRVTGTPTEPGLFGYRAVVTDSDSQIDGRDNDSVTLGLDFRVVAAGDPNAPTVTALSPTELSVTWVAAATGFAVTGHDVEYWSGSGATQTVSVTGAGTSVAITGLETGAPYTVRVKAKGDSQESPWSSSASGRTGMMWMLSMADTSVSAAEGGTADVTVTVDSAPASDLRLEFELGSDSDPATRDAGIEADLGTVPADVTLSAGDTEAVLSLPVDDDPLSELSEVLVVTLTGAAVAGTDPTPDRAQLGADVTTAVTIGASDPIRFSVTGPAELREDDGSASEYMVTLTGGSLESGLDVTIEPDGTADEGTDYDLSTTSLSFGPDDLVETFSIDPTDGASDAEGAETIVVGLSVPEGSVPVDPAMRDLTLTLHDDDVGTVYFGPAGGGTYDTEIVEGGEPLVIPVQYRGPSFSGSRTVPIVRNADSEAGASEYAIEPLQIVNGAAETSLTVYARYDGSAFEGAEELVLDFGLLPPEQSGMATLLAGDPDDPRVRARLTVLHNGTVPSKAVTLSSDTEFVPESAGTTGITVTATLTGSGTRPPNDVIVTLSLVGDGATEATPFPDLTIAAGSLAGSATVSLAPEDDSEAAGNRTIELRGSGTIDRNDGRPSEDLEVSAISVVIADDDSTGLAIGGPADTLDESVGDVVFTITLAERVGVELTVTVAPGDGGTAEEGTDYTAPAGADAEVVFPADAIPGSTRMVTVGVIDDAVNEPSETVVMSISGMSPDVSGMLTVAAATAAATIASSDPLYLILTAPDYTVPAGSPIRYGMRLIDQSRRNAISSTRVTGVFMSHGRTPSNSALGYRAITVTIPPGDSTVSFFGNQGYIAAGGNYTLDFNFTFNPGGGTIWRSSFLRDRKSVLRFRDSVRANFVTAGHGLSETDVGASSEIAVTLDSEHIMPVEVPIVVSSESGAAEGEDFMLSASTLTFDTGVTRQTFSVTALDDNIDEGAGEEIVLAFGNLPGGMARGPDRSATVTIADDDIASTSVTLSADTVSLDEARAVSVVAVGVTASLAGDVPRSPDLVLSLATNGEPESLAAATSGDDYSFGADPLPELTIPAGMQAGSVTLMLTLVDDDVVEPDEAIALTTAAEGFDITAVEVTITDGDTASVSVAGPAGPVAEDAGIAGFTVSLDTNIAADVTVTLASVGGTATGGADFIFPSGAGAEVTFPASSGAGASRVLQVEVTDDPLFEGEEEFGVTISGLTSDLAGRITRSPDEASAAIAASDPVTVSLSAPGTIAESVGELGVTLHFTGGVLSGETTVDLDYGGSAERGAAADYTGEDRLTFTGNRREYRGISLAIADDGIADAGETVEIGVALSGGGGGSFGYVPDPPTVAVGILDGAAPLVTVSLAGGDQTATEGGAAAEVTVGLDTDPGRALSFSVSVVAEGGASLSDYSVDPTVASFRGGTTTVTVRIVATDDIIDDPGERVELSLVSDSLPERVSVGSPLTATVTLADDDPPASNRIGLSLSTLSAAAPESLGDPVVFTPAGAVATVTETDGGIDGGGFPLLGLVAALEGPSALPDDLVVTVTLGGTAAGDDFRMLLDGEFDRELSAFANHATRIGPGETAGVTIPAGSLEGTLVFEAWAFEDQAGGGPLAEPAETVEFAGSAAGHDLTNTVTVTIVDRVAGHAAFAAGGFSGAEGDQVTLEVGLGHPSALPVTLSWRAVPAGELGSGSGSVVFPAYESPGTVANTAAMVTLDLASDSLIEADETVFVALVVPATDTPLSEPFTLTHSADDGTYSVAVGVVEDEETAMLSVSAPSGDAAEPGEAAFGVSLSAAPGTNITVTLTTSDGTATAGEDYTARSGAGATVTFADGEAAGSAKPFTVAVLDDNLSEHAETFSVGVAGVSPDFGSRLTLPENPAPATIGANDTLTVALSGPAAADEGASATYTVDVTGAESTAPVTVGIDASSDTAEAGDYAAPPAVLELPAGAPMTTFAVPLTEDGMPDAGEAVTVSVTSATGGGGPVGLDSLSSAVTTTIGETLAARVFSLPAALEEGDTATLALSLSSAPGQGVTVLYDISGSAGVDASDYTDMGSGRVSVATGAPVGIAMVDIEDDTAGELAETLTVTFRDVGFDGAAAGVVTFAGPTVAELTIGASDSAAVSLAGPASVTMAEGSTRSFRVEVSGEPAASAMTVTLATGGDATQDLDYEWYAGETRGGHLTIAAGSTVAQVRVTALEDAENDPDQTVELWLAGVEGGGGPVVLGQGTVTATILETNSPATFGADSGALLRRSVAESASAGDPAGAPVLATDPDASDTVQYRMADDAGGRFGIGPDGQITVADPSDFDHESGVTVHTVTVEASDGRDGSGRPDPAADDEVTVAITLEDSAEALPAPTGVSVSAAAAGGHLSLVAVWEAPSAAGVPPATGYELDWRVAGSDPGYTIVPSLPATPTSATIGGLAPGTRHEVRVRALNDEAPGEWSGPAEGDTGPASLVSMARGALEVEEGVGTVTVTVELGDASSANVTVTYGVSGADAADYTDEGGGRLTVAAGATSGLILLSVADDADAEPAETVTVSLSSVSAPGAANPAVLGVARETSVTIAASDALVAALAGPRAFDVAEGDLLPLTVSLSGAENTAGVTVGIGVVSPGAADLSSPLPGSVTLATGTNSARVHLRALADGGEDAGETVVVSVSAVSGPGAGTHIADPSPVTATIIEPNTAPVFAGGLPEVVRSRTVAENSPAGTAVGGALLATDADGDALSYSLEGAAPGFPFALSGARLTVVSPPDHESAATHRAVVAASDGKDARGLPDPSVDARVTVEVGVSDAAEPPPAPVAPSLTPPASGGHSALVVSWTEPDSVGRPPVTGYDVGYRRLGDAAFTDAGRAGAATSLTLAGLVPGSMHEARVRARNVDGAGAWSAPGTGRTEAGVGVSMAAVSESAPEGAAATVTVRVTSPADRPLTVGYGLRNVSAADSDRLDPGGGALTIAAGSRTGLIRLPLVDDFAGEGDEVFAVSLTSAMFAGDAPGRVPVLAPSETSVTILVSDALALSLSAPATAAADSVAEATVSVGGGPWSSPVTAGIDTAGSALPGAYSVPSSVVIAADQATAPLAVTVSAAAVVGDEIELWLSYRSGGVQAGTPVVPGVTVATITVGVSDTPASFDAGRLTFAVPEDLAAGGEIGVLPASDPDGEDSALTFRLASDGGGRFGIDAAGTLRLAAGASLDFESASAHTLEAEVLDGRSGIGAPDSSADDRARIVVRVRDVAEPPPAPGQPAVAAHGTAGHRRLALSWTAPPGEGGPPVSGYQVEIKAGSEPDSSYRRLAHGGTATSAVAGGLLPGTTYNVRVRAFNPEGVGAWSLAGAGATDAGLAVSMAEPSISVDEGASETVATVRVALAPSVPSASTVTVTYSVSDAGARVGADYALPSGGGTVTAVSGASSADILVTVLPDDFAEVAEAFVVRLDGVSGAGGLAALGTAAETSVTIRPNDAPVLGISAPATIAAGATVSATVTATGGARTSDIAVTISAGGDSVEGTDHATVTSPQTLRQADSSVAFDIAALDTATAGRLLELTIDAADPVLEGPRAATLTIVRPNAAPGFVGVAAEVTVGEDAAPGAAVGVTFPADPDAGDTPAFTLSDPARFTVGADRALSLAPGATLDHESAPAHTLVVTVSDGKGADGLPDRSADAAHTLTVVVSDVDEPPGRPDAPRVTGISGSELAAAWTEPENAGPPVVSYEVQHKRAGSPDSGYADLPRGAISGMAALIPGLAANADHDVRVRARSDEGAGPWSDPGTGATAQGLLILSAESAPALLSEGDGMVRLTLTASIAGTVAPETDLEMSVSVRADGDAAAHTDIGTVGLAVAAGSLEATRAVDVELQDDDTVGLGKRLVFEGEPGGGFAIVPVTVAVADDDTAGVTVVWDSSGTHVEEGEGAELRFVLDAPVDADVSLPWEVGLAGALDAGDIAAPLSGTVGFGSAGASAAASLTVTLDIEDDGLFEDEETVSVTLGPLEVSEAGLAADVTLENTGPVVFPVEANDTGTVNISGAEVEHTLGSGATTTHVDVVEGETATLTLSLAGGIGTEDISVPVGVGAAGEGHSAQGADFTAPTTPVTVSAGSATATFEVPTQADSDDDAGEVVAVTIGDPAGGAPNQDAARGSPAHVQVTIIEPNSAPEFADTAISVTLEENTRSVTMVSVTDPEGHAVTYRIFDDPLDSDTDPGLFTIDAAGTVSVADGARLDESRPSLTVTIEALDGRDGRGIADTAADTSLVLEVSVTDVDEPPPMLTTVTAAALPIAMGGHTRVSVSWSPLPDGYAGPPVTYEVQMRLRSGTDDDYVPFAHDGAGTAATVTGLEPETEYLIRVRVRNDEDGGGIGAWAALDAAGVTTRANTAPDYAPASAAREVPENTAAGGAVGDPLPPDVNDEDALAYTLTGDRADVFGVDAATGQVTVAMAEALDFEALEAGAGAVFPLTLEVEDEFGETDAIRLDIAVTDADEPPGEPANLSVDATTSSTRLTLSWDAPANTGPPLLGYEFRYRETGDSGFTGAGDAGYGVAHVAGETVATITDLEADTGYDVEVRATNDEGGGGWAQVQVRTGNAPSFRVPLANGDPGAAFGHADALVLFYSLRFGNFLRANPRLLTLVYNRLFPSQQRDEAAWTDVVLALEELDDPGVVPVGHPANVYSKDGSGLDHIDALMIFYSIRFGTFLLANPRLLNLVFNRLAAVDLTDEELADLVRAAEDLANTL